MWEKNALRYGDTKNVTPNFRGGASGCQRKKMLPGSGRTRGDYRRKVLKEDSSARGSSCRIPGSTKLPSSGTTENVKHIRPGEGRTLKRETGKRTSTFGELRGSDHEGTFLSASAS